MKLKILLSLILLVWIVGCSHKQPEPEPVPEQKQATVPVQETTPLSADEMSKILPEEMKAGIGVSVNTALLELFGKTIHVVIIDQESAEQATKYIQTVQSKENLGTKTENVKITINNNEYDALKSLMGNSIKLRFAATRFFVTATYDPAKEKQAFDLLAKLNIY
jgi:hypothetical protein